MPEKILSPRAALGALACAALVAGGGVWAGGAHATGPPTAKADPSASQAAHPRDSHAIAPRARVVRPNGQVGPFQLFRTTEEMVRTRVAMTLAAARRREGVARCRQRVRRPGDHPRGG